MMWDPGYDGWVMLIAALAAVACALPGTFLLLRGMSMMGDAISHAVLPGIAVGFLISGSRESVWIFGGALLAGVLVAACSYGLHRLGRVERGAAMGVVFTAMFAAGLILVVQAADQVELDPHCVLEGAIEWAPLDQGTFLFGTWTLPRAVPPLLLVILVNLSVIIVCFKEFTISAFDPEMARSSGLRIGVINQALMVMTAATCVACFEVVGSILVVALLVIPPAIARLLSDRLVVILVVAVGAAVAMATLGHLAAISLPGWVTSEIEDVSTSGMIAVVGGALFLATWIGSPRHGLVLRGLRRGRIRIGIAVEDALGMLYRCEEQHRDLPRADLRRLLMTYAQAGRLESSLAIATLRRAGLADVDGGVWSLTATGRNRASHVIRTHRLWEVWLSRHLGLPADHVHDSAMRLEHVTDATMQGQLAREAAAGGVDPHGKPIPPRADSGGAGPPTRLRD